MIGLYEQSRQQEAPADDQVVAEVFAEANVVLSGQVVRTLQEVREFHRQVVVNRLAFLDGEIGRLREEIATRETEVAQLTQQRAERMRVLRSHGALEEYNRLQQLHAVKRAELEDLDRKIALWDKLEQEQSSLRIERERLRLDARADLEERRSGWEEAIALFSANSEFLYEAPGELVIDLKDTGFQFDVEIARSGSQGINHMKVFCYDLMLAQMWAPKLMSPEFLVHDSIIFDGVDERQRGRAIRLAAQQSVERGFQYICCLNSDMVPYSELGDEFNLDDYTALTLTDATEDGGLLGMQF